jgi:hypothetical protein
LLDVAAKVCIQPFVAELIAKLEVLGSFPGLSLTGEMRTPLSLTDVEIFEVMNWVLVVVEVRRVQSISDIHARLRNVQAERSVR